MRYRLESWKNPCRLYCRADSRLAPRQWETLLQSNTVSHWLGANLKSALYYLLVSLDRCNTPPLINSLGRVTHICVSNLTINGSDNGLSPGRRQAIIWTNAGTLSIGQLGTNFSEILIKILTFSFKKMNLKMSSGKWLPFYLGLNVLTNNNGGSAKPMLKLRYGSRKTFDLINHSWRSISWIENK